MHRFSVQFDRRVLGESHLGNRRDFVGPRLCFILGLMASAPERVQAHSLHLKPTKAVLHQLQTAAVKYFIDQAHPATGLIRDRARNHGRTPHSERYAFASIAATGFGYAVLAHASQIGLANRALVYEQLLKTTEFLTTVQHHKGWFLHFMHWDSGAAFGNTEISTIDTALFFAGALYAAQIFHGTLLETKIHWLFQRLDFQDMLTDGGSKPGKQTFSHGKLPGGSYLTAQWDTYAEHMILLILALGSNEIPAEVWRVSLSEGGSGPTLTDQIQGRDLPLFVHQYSHLFVDFRDFPNKGSQWFENSRVATQFNKSFCQNRTQSKTYREGFWGLSATDTPEGYFAYAPFLENGTVCPPCAGGSIMFLPDAVAKDLVQWRNQPFMQALWGQYGMADSLNLDRNWVNPDAVGITVGPLYLAIANALGNPSVWNDFMQLDIVKKAREKLALLSTAKLAAKSNVRQDSSR
jgi:hypothetical protein